MHVFRHNDVAYPSDRQLIASVMHAVDEHFLDGIVPEEPETLEARDRQEMKMLMFIMAS